MLIGVGVGVLFPGFGGSYLNMDMPFEFREQFYLFILLNWFFFLRTILGIRIL